MPYVVNGVGTWYYGKRRIHRLKGVCAFCNHVGELESYDTTLYFVFLMVPLLPLSRKRVLDCCPRCQQHRVLSLKKWEESKAQAITELLAKLEANPDNPETIKEGLGLAAGFQDKELFDKLATTLAEHRREDAAIQAQLGATHGYFAEFPQAEAAYRASLAVRDDEEVRQQLALALLKQGRPEEAHPYLRHILDQRRAEHAGLIYLLVEGYQAQGRHKEALDLMDRRDEAFPQFAASKDLQQQRKLSQKHLDSGKPIRSAFLTESRKAGYQEGSWTAKLPWVIGPLVAAALLAWYLGSAVWIGQSRKVYFVNGWDRPYAVRVGEQDVTLPPGAPTEVRVNEGETTVAFTDPQMPLPPFQFNIDTPFFSRPFANRTFVVNPDELAILMEEKTEYSEDPAPFHEPPVMHPGRTLHSFAGLDYEFQDFPASLQASKGSRITKTRVALLPNPPAEERLRLLAEHLDRAQQIAYAKRLLSLRPDDLYFLFWLVARATPDEAQAFLEQRLEQRPPLVEWHRAYQSLLEKHRPDHDLRPRYQKLVQETGDQADALYLLARVTPEEEADALLQRAAKANPPSMHAHRALGFRALASGRFADAVPFTEKALKLAPDYPRLKEDYWNTLLAAEQYDRLLADLRQGAGPDFFALLMEIRVHAVRKDKAKAQEVAGELLRSLPPIDPKLREIVQASIDVVICCVDGDTAGFLKASRSIPQFPGYASALLELRLDDAAGLVEKDDADSPLVRRALVYLAADRAKYQALAKAQWQQLLVELAKEDRETRKLGEILTGKAPADIEVLRRLAIDPKQKRALLAVAARRLPDHAKELKELARKLDFHRDATSLCLKNLLD